MTELSDDQLNALRNLARKQAGEEVDWIAIASARALTDMGLAERHAGGWNISPLGSQALAEAEPRRGPKAPVHTLKPSAD